MSKFKERWSHLEKNQPVPRKLRQLKEISFDELKVGVQTGSEKFVNFLVDSLYAGDCFIIHGVFKPEQLRSLKERAYEYGKKVQPAYHKILDGCPNYHVVVDKPMGPPGGYVALDHSYYFFRWNEDPLGLFPMVAELWKAVKLLGGFQENEYQANIPSKGVVDRVQVHHYASGAGKITTHTDPYKNQKVIAGALLTEAGKDYKEGGFYIIDESNVKQNFESKIPLGSVVMCSPALMHGVDVIDSKRTADWNKIDGRWYLSVYSVDSHAVANRTTALSPDQALV